VREDDDIDVLEVAVANVIGFGPEELFGDARPQFDSAGDLLPLHDFLEHDRGGDIERHPRVVPFAVSGSTFDERIVIRHAGLLRPGRNPIDVGAQGNDRFA
jgi:hypothetical protein